MKKIKIFFYFIFILLSLLYYFYPNETIFYLNKINLISKELTRDLNFIYFNNYNNDDNFFIIQNKLDFYNSINDSLNLSIYFCPYQDCEYQLFRIFNNSKLSIYCAFYDLNSKSILEILHNKSEKINVSLIIDDENYYKRKNLIKKYLKDSFVKSDKYRNSKYNNYMHNKFCIIDNNVVITGSTNPTYNGFHRNNNNLLIIHSKYLSKNYMNEFNQMWEKHFGREKSKSTIYFPIKDIKKNITIFNCFSPQEDCKSLILNYLNKSSKSIYFAFFALTDDEISKSLLIKFKKNIPIKGVIEKQNINTKGSDFNLIKNFTLLDKNKYKLHHKYIIIDNETVITGSLNPTKSGFSYNDENIVIIDNPEIVDLYLKDFKYLTN